MPLLHRAAPLLTTTILLLILCSPGIGLRAQEEAPPAGREREERFKFLELKRAALRLEEVRGDYERARELQEKELIAREEFDRIATEFRAAEVDYSRALLDLIFDRPHILIEGAVKYQTVSGEKRVRVTVTNTAGGSFEMASLKALEAETAVRDLKLDRLANVFVSLKVDDTIISQPYEVRIPVLWYGEPHTIDFGLLRDVDAVVVSVAYADRVVEKKILLQKDASANLVTVVSEQFSQEADLGSSATYDLRLERFTREGTSFKLVVVGLPKQIHYEFLDTRTDARLSQVRFTEGVTTQDLLLTLHLPERADDRVAIDRPLEFWALVLDPATEAALGQGDGQEPSREVIERLRAGKVRLELVPRGVGEIEVQAVNLYHEIHPGETVGMEMTVRNAGSRRLENITIRVEAPFEWRHRVVPEVIDSLGPLKERRVAFTFEPPAAIAVGDHEVRIRTEATADGRPVKTEDKSVRVHVTPRVRLWATLALVGSLVGLVAGIVVLGIRLSRR